MFTFVGATLRSSMVSLSGSVELASASLMTTPPTPDAPPSAPGVP
jgi:hypothetical protein